MLSLTYGVLPWPRPFTADGRDDPGEEGVDAGDDGVGAHRPEQVEVVLGARQLGTGDGVG